MSKWGSSNGRAPDVKRMKVGSVAWCSVPDGRFLVSGGTDWGIEVWGAKRGSGWEGISHRGPILSLAFSPDGKTLISGSGNGTVRLWDFIVVPLPSSVPRPEGKPMRSWDGIRVERKTGFAGRKRGIAGHISGVSSIVFNPNGKTFTTVTLDGTVRLWDAATDQLMATFTGRTDTGVGVIDRVAFSPDRKTLAGTSKGWADNTVRLWNAVTGERESNAHRS